MAETTIEGEISVEFLIKYAEKLNDQVIEWGLLAMRHRRAMKSAIVMLDHGQPENARKVLQDVLDMEERRAARKLKREGLL